MTNEILKTYRLLVYDQDGYRLNDECGGPFEDINAANDYAISLGYKDGDR